MPRKQKDKTVVAHISDLHFTSTTDCTHDARWLALAQDLGRNKPDILAVTGDLIDSSISDSNDLGRIETAFEAVYQYLTKTLCASAQIDSDGALFVVPGNHDYRLKGLIWRKPLFDLFHNRFKVYFHQSILRQLKIIVFVFDSNPRELGVNLATGLVPEKDLISFSGAAENLARTEPAVWYSTTRIALLHHHPMPIAATEHREELTDREEFLLLKNAGLFMNEMVRSQIDLVLHGHKHYPSFSRASFPVANSREQGITLPELELTKLRGAIGVDPRTQDFFKVVIEERKRLSSRTDLSQVERERLDKALKVLANAASYGIYAEMNRQESDHKVNVTCHGIDAEPFACRVAHPDVPGEYCFPPLASLITGAARLMLALLEHCVCELGGTYAMEDTDSMAIVATEHGGMVPCPGGPGGAVKAFSWKQVQEMSQRFAALNPYDRGAVPGSILKIEQDNFDPTTGKQRQLWCLAISAKRYALFLQDENAFPVLLREGVNNKEDRWSEHGLGHLLNPTDPQSEDRDWIAQVWLNLVRRASGLSTENPKFESSPAVGRVTISSPAVMRRLASFNEGKLYSDQIKPFNFLLSCHVKQLGHPIGVNPERFHLIAPYESDSRRWLKTEWIDQYTGKRYRITTGGDHGTRQAARVKTYGEILREYEFHPESKCADAGGKPCGKQTIGLLQRRHIRIEQIKYIGKESNGLEEVEAGLMHSAQNIYTEYSDPRRDEWQTKIVPALKKAPLGLLVKLSGKSRRMLIKARTGRSRPHGKNQELLVSIVRELGLV